MSHCVFVCKYISVCLRLEEKRGEKCSEGVVEFFHWRARSFLWVEFFFHTRIFFFSLATSSGPVHIEKERKIHGSEKRNPPRNLMNRLLSKRERYIDF